MVVVVAIEFNSYYFVFIRLNEVLVVINNC